MNYEKIEGSKVKFNFEVTAEEFSKAIDEAFVTENEKVEIKGFRKGHAPRSIYEKNYGVESLFEEAVNVILKEKYPTIFDCKEVEIVSQPQIELDWLKLEAGKGFTFSIIAAVKPEVELGEYKGIEAKGYDTNVDAKEVEKEINNLLTKDADLVVKNGAIALGDTAVFDFDGSVDGVAFDGGKAENYTLEIGSNQFIPGFEDQMVGLSEGQEKDVVVTFPKEYHAVDLAGKEAVFKVKIHEVKEFAKKELNDEFVLGLKKEGINTVDELKADIEKNLKEYKERQEKNRVIDEIVSKVAESAKVEIPEAMVSAEKEQLVQDVTQKAKQYNLDLDMYIQLSGSTKERFEADLAKEANKKVLYNLVIEAIAKKEAIEATEEDFEKKYNEFAAMYKMEAEKIKEMLPKDMLAQEIVFGKTLDFLVLNANLK